MGSRGYKERTSRGAPCIFCGDVGLDMKVTYPETEDVVYWCHKTHATKGTIMSVAGRDYICIATDYETAEATMGKFDLWKEYLSKEEWIAKQERINPDWKPSISSRFNSNAPRKMHYKPVEFITPKEGELLEGEEPVLSHRELDTRYRALLSLLTMEDKHRVPLLEEWKSPIYDVSNILDDFLLRSLPPPDKARFKSSYQYKNPTRKAAIGKLYDMFGSLKGIPGIYMRSGSYWDEMPEKERYTFSFPHEAVIYPCFDKDGFLYALRVKDELPDLEVKESKHKPYQDHFGIFNRYYDNDGYLRCSFTTKEGKKMEVDPADAYGKPKGKYKPFTSVSEKKVESEGKIKVVNSFKCGSKSETAYSLITRPGDNMKIVIGTEGEKKAMVANAIKKVPCVSIPGVTHYNIIFRKDENGISLIDYLKSKGMKYFIVCYDADKEDNQMVYDSEQNFLAALKAHGVQPMIGSWKQDFDKGLDDILLKGIEMVISPA